MSGRWSWFCVKRRCNRRRLRNWCRRWLSEGGLDWRLAHRKRLRYRNWLSCGLSKRRCHWLTCRHRLLDGGRLCHRCWLRECLSWDWRRIDRFRHRVWLCDWNWLISWLSFDPWSLRLGSCHSWLVAETWFCLDGGLKCLSWLGLRRHPTGLSGRGRILASHFIQRTWVGIKWLQTGRFRVVCRLDS